MLLMAVRVVMEEMGLMAETVLMAPSHLMAGRVVRAEQIRTHQGIFIFPEQNSNATRGSRMQ
ncbi:hypothetical protein SP99_01124 [Enterobacter sp. BIDMC92]|nr:hypothetical protein SP99_01124 [Enterobacter sp. BIDMC92]